MLCLLRNIDRFVQVAWWIKYEFGIEYTLNRFPFKTTIFCYVCFVIYSCKHPKNVCKLKTINEQCCKKTFCFCSSLELKKCIRVWYVKKYLNAFLEASSVWNMEIKPLSYIINVNKFQNKHFSRRLWLVAACSCESDGLFSLRHFGEQGPN